MFDRSRVMVGFHTIIAESGAVDSLIELVNDGLAPMGFNTLVLEMRYSFRCFPEFSTGTVQYQDAERIAGACARHGIRVVPLLPCLGHQSLDVGGRPTPLLRAHPEYLERQDVPEDAEWPDFMGHSWCAAADGVYDYIFPMIDEMAEACGAEAFHVGLDEVFEIGHCQRCKDMPPDALFARTVKKLHDHLTAKGLDMMMWGDRLLDARAMGYSMWEGDRFGMHPALSRADEVTRDIIICDWHYEWHSAGYPSVETFVREGFFTVPSFWRDAENAKHFWLHALEAHYLGARCEWPGKLGGLLFTNWRALNAESARNMLLGMRGGTAPSPDAPGWDIGNVIAQVAPKGKHLRK